MELETKVESEGGVGGVVEGRVINAAHGCCLFVFTAVLSFAADDSPDHLIWRDGSSLGGRITSATANGITIQSPVFGEPLVLDSSVIGEVQFGRGAPPEAEPFLFSLKDGALVTGSIASIDEKQVIARNRTLGELVIPTGDLLSIQKASQRDLDFGDVSPASNPRPPSPPPDANAALAARAGIPASGLFQPVRLSERCDVVLKMRTQPKPTFRLIITGANSQRVTVEAKNGDLILQGRVFVLIKNINAVDGAVNLHLYWNQRTGQCALCTSAGVTIAETNKGPVGTIVASDSQGVLIQDAVPNFAIAYLGVNSWDGMLPLANETEGPGVILTDDSAIKGRVVAASGGTVSVRGPDGRVSSVPLEKVFRIRFVPVRSTPSKAGLSDVWFADGSRLDGRLTSIRDGVATFETPLSPKPLSFLVTAMRQMICHEQSETEKKDVRGNVSRLEINDRVLFGELGEGAAVVHWKPTGSKRAVPLAKGVEYSISRPAVSETADGVVFHLAGGEVLSGKLTGMTGKEVEGEWAFGSHFKLPTDRVRAIQFPSDRIQMKGFSDEGWSPNAEKGSAVSLKEEEALLSGTVSLGHPDVMRASDIQFVWQPEGNYCSMELSMFQPEAKPSSSGLVVRFYCTSNKLQVMKLDAQRTNVYLNVGSVFIETGRPMTVKMEVADDAVAMRINDSTRMLIPTAASQRAGNGLAFSIRQSSIMINNLRINGQLQNLPVLQRVFAGKPIRIRDFVATTNASNLRPAGGVIAATRQEALQIPRFRQDAPPKHVIVAANRDLLRGEVEAVASDHLLFRTGLETVKVPLSRLAAIMTPLPVKKPDDSLVKKDEKTEGPNALVPGVDGSAKAADESGNVAPDPALVFVTLSSGGRVRLVLDAVRDGAITGRHPHIGVCRIPLNIVTGIGIGGLSAKISTHALEEWRWEFAPEPALPETGGQSSLAIGKDAATFKLPLLGGGDFDLAEEKGKVVVLDFWATWCGPCVKSLPELTKAMAAFSPDKVTFIGVNQGEGGEVVKRFLETRGMKMTVAMDGAQSVARLYGVEGIPHTVIIGPDGKVAWVKTGFSPEGAREAAAAVTRLVGPK